MKRWMLALIISLPLASVAFGGVMLYFAISTNDVDVLEASQPMSKVSWKQGGTAEPEVQP